MIVTRRTRLILGCLADVRRDRARVAQCWCYVRDPRSLPLLWARKLRAAMRWLESSERLLVLAWDCCVQREAAPACDA